MKYIFTLLVAAFAIVGTVSAATGSTSTTSTSTGTTLSGATSTGAVVSCKFCGAGGVTTGWNRTTSRTEIVPQCFPWVWLLEYYKGNIFDMYRNQEACRAKRLVDFGL